MNQWNNLKTHLIFTMIESWLFKKFDVFFYFPSNITVPLKFFPFVGEKLKGDREWENKMYSKSNEHFDTLVYHMSNCQRMKNSTRFNLVSLFASFEVQNLFQRYIHICTSRHDFGHVYVYIIHLCSFGVFSHFNIGHCFWNTKFYTLFQQIIYSTRIQFINDKSPATFYLFIYLWT